MALFSFLCYNIPKEEVVFMSNKALGCGYLNDKIIEHARTMGANRMPIKQIAIFAQVTPHTVSLWYNKGEKELNARSEKIEAGQDVGEMSKYARFYLAYEEGNLEYEQKILQGMEAAVMVDGKWQGGKEILEQRNRKQEMYVKDNKLEVDINSKYDGLTKDEIIEAIVRKQTIAKEHEESHD